MSAGRDLYVDERLSIRGGELHEVASRSSGPGGQNVNKTSTRVSLRWSVADSGSLTDEQRSRLEGRLGGRLTRGGELIVTCDRTRSRARNRELARERMAELVAGALIRRTPRRATKPTGASRARRLVSKTRRSDVKRARRPVDSRSD